MTSTDAKPDAEHPAKPDSPLDLTKPAWRFVARKTLREFLADECTDLAAALTYYAVLSIFPALIATVSLLALIGQAEATTATIVNLASNVVPPSAMDQLEPVVLELTSAPGAGLGLVIGLLTAMWTASNFVNAFSRAMNRIYEVSEGRPFWKLRPLMFGITAVTLVLLALAALMLVLSGPVAEAIGGMIGLGDAALTTWSVVKWPALLAVVVVVVALLYYATPNVEQPKFRWMTLGSLVAILTAIVASLLLGLYLSKFGSYDETYGTLAGVIIFLLWIWIVNVALLFGAEFDAEMERGRQLQAGLPAEEQIQLPPRDTRASDKKAEQEKEDFEAARDLRRSAGWEEPTDEPEDDEPPAGVFKRLKRCLSRNRKRSR